MAAGNLFTGTFKYTSAGLGGTGAVNFGQKYTYTARPSALQVKYRAKINAVDMNVLNGPLAKRNRTKHAFLSQSLIGHHSILFHLPILWEDQTMVALVAGIRKQQQIPAKARLSVMALYGSLNQQKPIGKMLIYKFNGTIRRQNLQREITL